MVADPTGAPTIGGGPLSPLQLTSLRESSARVNVWEGSIRSGKTIASLLRWLIYVATWTGGGELIVFGRTRDSIARNVFGPLTDPAVFGDIANHVSYTSGAPTANILGKVVHVLGASDVKAEMVLRGMTCGGAYGDELTVIPEQFFTQTLGRMSVPGAKLFGTTNPDSPAHWLKKKFLDRLGQLPDWRRWHFTLDDNPSLDPAYVASIKAEYTGLWYRRFIAGEWVAAEGAIYDMWDPDKHVVSWDELPVMQRLLGVGIDYGTSTTSAALLLGVGADSRLYMIDEWRYDRDLVPRSLTDAQQSAALRDWMARQHLPGKGAEPRIEWVFVDPAAASFKAQLFSDGVRNVANAQNDVAYGLRTVASLLGNHRLIVTDRCTGWINEAPGYSWDPEASKKGEDKPIKVADHSLDGGRYVIASTETLWRKHIPMTPLREAA